MIALLLLLACDGRDDTDAVDCDAPGTICAWVGTGTAGLAEEGACREDAPLYLPLDVAVSPAGTVYFEDWNNHRVVRLAAGETCDTLEVVTGTTLLGDGPEGDMTLAAWNHPTDLAFESEDVVFMAAWHNSRVVRLDLAAGTAEFYAGTGARDFGGDGGPAETALLDLPASVELDDAGNLYVADQANQRVRVIDPDGTIDTCVGTGEYGYNGDGIPAKEAMLFNELSQAANPSGKLSIANGRMFIADTGNHRVRAVDLQTWMIDTVAGDGTVGSGGDGGPAKDAQLNAPRDVQVAPDGSIYIADSGNNCVRRVNPDGTIETVAGVCGPGGFAGDGGPAIDALLAWPAGIDVSPDGATLYVADTFNHVIRTVALE